MTGSARVRRASRAELDVARKIDKIWEELEKTSNRIGTMAFNFEEGRISSDEGRAQIASAIATLNTKIEKIDLDIAKLIPKPQG